eukprot:TRINITY_DN5621_c0_g1_i2.p1 TRINITY_DN5621_c0_g1~~TRINITY_DN5621_c0_g1_i2.p1  ORF type:complete len:534 (+),score=139.88 TRINITY_DN5621_c0_g1_i2:292-1893(+)
MQAVTEEAGEEKHKHKHKHAHKHKHTEHAQSGDVTEAAAVDIATMNVLGEDELTPLHRAVRDNEAQHVLQFVAAGVDLSVKTGKGQTALQFAMDCKSEDAALALLKCGAALNTIDEEGNTLLHTAAKNDLAKVIVALLDSQADVAAVNANMDTPLHVAVDAVSLEAVMALGPRVPKPLLSQGNSAGNTPLHVACLKKDTLPIVKKLIELGANINAQNKMKASVLNLAVAEDNNPITLYLLSPECGKKDTTDSCSALYYAACKGCTDDVTTQLKYGADPNERMRLGGWAPLHGAAALGHLGAVQALLHGGADVNLQDAQGNTALYHACIAGRDHVACYLLTLPIIDVNLSPKNGWKPIHAVCRRGLVRVLEDLLKLKPDLNTHIQSYHMYAPVHVAIAAEVANAVFAQSITGAETASAVTILKLLVEAGADINEQNEAGMTPLHMACCKSANTPTTMREIVAYLLSLKTLKPKAKDKRGRTSLEVACSFGSEQLAEMVAKRQGAKKLHKLEYHPIVCEPFDNMPPSPPVPTREQ